MNENVKRILTKIHNASEQGSLSFFVGAGVSMLSGQPSWEKLLDNIKSICDEVVKKNVKKGEVDKIIELILEDKKKNKLINSIRNIKGSTVSVRDFLIEFFQRLELAFLNFHQTDWIGETRKLSATTGKRVRIENPAGSFSGIASGINDDGSLSVTLENGDIIRATAGDCIHS